MDIITERYQILKKIGEGGFGEVFLVFDLKNEQEIVLKKMRLDKEQFEKRKKQFLHECHFTQTLSHPAILPIFEITEEENLIFYTMPFVKGGNLF